MGWLGREYWFRIILCQHIKPTLKFIKRIKSLRFVLKQSNSILFSNLTSSILYLLKAEDQQERSVNHVAEGN